MSISAHEASELAAEQQRLRAALTSSGKDYAQRLSALQEIIAAPTFKSLSLDDQYEALTLAARVSMYGKRPKLANDYIARVVALPGLVFEDEVTALGTAREIGNWAAAARCVTSIAQQWPERFGEIESRTTWQVVYEANHLPRSDKLLLLQALYAAHWTLKWGIEPSSSWRDLTLLLMEQSSLREAIEVSKHVTDVHVLIEMRADRRLDAVVAASPQQFDIEAAAAMAVKSFQRMSEEQPKSLALKALVLEALLHEQHYAAALADSDSVVQDIRSTNFPDKLYDDYVEQHAAYFYLRSVALQREKRWDQAVAQLVEAGHEGDLNQLINLGFLYCSLDRPKDAIAVVGTIGPARTNEYGAMQVEAVKLQSAVQLGDRVQVSRSLAYLSSHRTDAPRAYLYALIAAKQLDQAARYLVSELQDKELREGVLADVQDYPATPESEAELELDARWHSIVARKEVQAAIQKVGKVESYHLEGP